MGKQSMGATIVQYRDILFRGLTDLSFLAFCKILFESEFWVFINSNPKIIKTDVAV